MSTETANYVIPAHELLSITAMKLSAVGQPRPLIYIVNNLHNYKSSDFRIYVPKLRQK